MDREGAYFASIKSLRQNVATKVGNFIMEKEVTRRQLRTHGNDIANAIAKGRIHYATPHGKVRPQVTKVEADRDARADARPDMVA